MMKVVIKDKKTGEVRDCGDFGEFAPEWWISGNGSCDCNRSLAFDVGDEDNGEAQRISLGLEENRCLGAERWLIVDVYGDLDGRIRDDILSEVNAEYSAA